MKKSEWKARAKRLQAEYDLFIKPLPDVNPYYAISAPGYSRGNSKAQIHTLTKAGELRVNLELLPGQTIYALFYAWEATEGGVVAYRKETDNFGELIVPTFSQRGGQPDGQI